VQIVALGPEFQRCLKKAQDQYHGWGKLALLELIDAVGDLAEAVGE
jgi:hypothetical protein